MAHTPRLLALAVVVALAGCDALAGDDAAVVTGTVVNAETSRPITGATVQIRPLGIEMVSDSVGAFTATVEADSAVVLEITAFKTGFEGTVTTTTVEPGQALSVPALELRPTTGDDGTSGPATSVTLSARTPQSIGVSEAGGDETAVLEFVVLDADEKPVDTAHAVDLAVKIIQGPGGGEFLSPAAPETVRTDEDGRAVVTLTSGRKAGVVQIEVQATAGGGRTFRSQPITLAIHGGFPSQDHLSVVTAQKNHPALDVVGYEIDVTALVGDRYANPVQRGTQVYFTSTTGVIAGSGETQADGRARSVLVTGRPFPVGGALSTATARTSGVDGEPISAETVFLLSGRPQLTLVTAGTDLGTYDYTVSDQHGNPLAPGTTITVTVEGQNVKARGDVAVSLGDFVEPGPKTTAFQFSITVADPQSEDAPRVDEIKIGVSGPNGSVSDSRVRSGSARRSGAGGLAPGRTVVGKMPHEM